MTGWMRGLERVGGGLLGNLGCCCLSQRPEAPLGLLNPEDPPSYPLPRRDD